MSRYKKGGRSRGRKYKKSKNALDHDGFIFTGKSATRSSFNPISSENQYRSNYYDTDFQFSNPRFTGPWTSISSMKNLEYKVAKVNNQSFLNRIRNGGQLYMPKRASVNYSAGQKPVIRAKSKRSRLEDLKSRRKTLLGKRVEDFDIYQIGKEFNYSEKGSAKMDKALKTEMYFKRNQKHPNSAYKHGESGKTKQLRNSMEPSAFKVNSRKANFMAAGDSTRETHAMTEMKSSFNQGNVSSEYSFYDRGFKEYEGTSNKVSKRKRPRPFTADVRKKKANFSDRRLSRCTSKNQKISKEEKKIIELTDMFSEWNKKEQKEEERKAKIAEEDRLKQVKLLEEKRKLEEEADSLPEQEKDTFLGFKLEEITPNMDIEDFIKLGERMIMREKLAKTVEESKKPKSPGKHIISEEDAKIIKEEFKKEMFERDWAKVYEILNHLKKLNNSLIVHEMKIG